MTEVRRGGTAQAVAAMLAAAMLSGTAQAAADSGKAGQHLFEGRAPVTARIAGHADALPAHAWRCVNCHAGAQAVGGLLSRERLVTPVPRRGGPPSRYELATFCRLLRDGIDPAWILIDHAMPRFELDDRQCEQLWTYLTTGG